jgi:hypothetical protein
MRSFVIEFLKESVELSLLLQDVGARRASGFFLPGEMHAFMAAVLLRMAGPDALNRDTEPEPPNREFGELKQAMRRGEPNPMRMSLRVLNL